MWTCPPAPEGFAWKLLYGQAGVGLADLSLLPGGPEVASVVRWRGGWAVLLNAHRPGRGNRFHPVPSRARALAWTARWAAVNRARLVAEIIPPSRLAIPFSLDPPPR